MACVWDLIHIRCWRKFASPWVATLGKFKKQQHGGQRGGITACAARGVTHDRPLISTHCTCPAGRPSLCAQVVEAIGVNQFYTDGDEMSKVSE